jgi:hypothetical protein
MDARIQTYSAEAKDLVIFSQSCRAVILEWLSSRPSYAVFFDGADPNEEIASFTQTCPNASATYSVTADKGGRFSVWTGDAEELGSFGTINGALAELGRWI